MEARASLNQSIDGLRRLLEIQADANLLTGLLIESSMVTDIASLASMRGLVSSAERDIDNNLKALPESDERSKIGALYGKLAALPGDSGILTLRTIELRDEAGAQQVYAAALADAAKLRTAVENLIQHQGTVAEDAGGACDLADQARPHHSRSAQYCGAHQRRTDCLALGRMRRHRPFDVAERRDAPDRGRGVGRGGCGHHRPARCQCHRDFRRGAAAGHGKQGDCPQRHAAAERTREVSASVVQVSYAAGKTNQVARAVLNASSELAARSGRLRAEVERFLAQVRAA